MRGHPAMIWKHNIENYTYRLYCKHIRKLRLRYIGVTTRDPYEYKGSSRIWLKLSETNEVKTRVLYTTKDITKFNAYCKYVTERLRIVERDCYVNVMGEAGYIIKDKKDKADKTNGVGGGGLRHTDQGCMTEAFIAECDQIMEDMARDRVGVLLDYLRRIGCVRDIILHELLRDMDREEVAELIAPMELPPERKKGALWYGRSKKNP